LPGPTVDTFHGDETLPAAVDVVVIGGGIIGASTALELAERGVRVALCEKGGIAREQSSRNWGWVRISRRDPREVPLMAESLRLWRGMDARLGRPTGYVRSGIVFTCADEAALAEAEGWARALDDCRIEHRMLSKAEFAEVVPGTRLDVRGALHTLDDGRAEPQKAAPAIAERARALGAHVLTECAVRGIETAAGAVSGVVTERGPIACTSVVLAGGAWSSLFAGRAGIDLPQLKVRNTVMRTEPLEGGPEPTVSAPDFAVRKRADGGYTVASWDRNIVDLVPASFRYARAFLPALRAEWRMLRFRLGGAFVDEMRMPRTWPLDEASPFEYVRTLDPAPDRAECERVLGIVRRHLPAFERARIAQRWAGCIDVTPDAVPVISPVERIPGFFIATGFSGHGFGIGPAAGRLAADLVTGAAPVVDPSAFRLSRFRDGTRMEILGGY
jgi:glycine/D-amino acid oxidase-like deaminating enzyme